MSSRTPHPTSASASPPDSTAARLISDASHSSLLSLSSDTIQALLQKSLRVSFPESRVEHLLRKFTLSLLQSLVSTRVGLADTSANTTTSWPKIPPTGRRYFLRRILRHLASPHHFTLLLFTSCTYDSSSTTYPSRYTQAPFTSSKQLVSKRAQKKKSMKLMPT